MAEDEKQNESSINILARRLGELSAGMNEIINGITKTVQTYASKLVEIASSEFMKDFSSVLQEIGKDILEASNNPNSVFNYSKYENRLNDFHWAWPYEIDAETLLAILQTVDCEKEFDDAMLKLFTDEKITKIIIEAKKKVAKHHKILLSQVENGISNRNYALVNNALMSIIDNSLSVYLEDKGCVTRKNIFKPILKHYENYGLDQIGAFIFDLCMLSNNINFIFDNVDFTQKIDLKTNKVARRHASLHGFSYSNKKIDTIMLLNTLVALMKIRPYLQCFENGIKYNRKKKDFCFTDKMNRKIMKERATDIIDMMMEIEGSVTHNSILKCFEEADIFESFTGDRGKYISKILQSMKQKGIIRRVYKENGWYWVRNEDVTDSPS